MPPQYSSANSASLKRAHRNRDNCLRRTEQANAIAAVEYRGGCRVLPPPSTSHHQRIPRGRRGPARAANPLGVKLSQTSCWGRAPARPQQPRHGPRKPVQDQYFGDINDYRKYGLLRCICEAELHVGVCWMKTPSDNSGQGGRTDYLAKPHKYRSLDPELFDFLQKRVQSDQRAIQELEAASDALLPGATFFSETLPTVAVPREAYFSRALAALRTVDVIFFDPDIGIAPPSAGRNSSKHLYWHEVERVACGQASVVIFWHRPQAEPWPDFLARSTFELRTRIPTASVYAIRSPFVAFVVACRVTHREGFAKAMDRSCTATVDW